MARVEATSLLALCLLMHGVTSISVNSALAGLQKLNEVKDMLGNIENAISTLRGGKHSRTFNVDDDGIVDKEKKSETAERQIVDDRVSERSQSTDARQRQTDARRRDNVDDDQFARQLKELVAVLRGTHGQCAAIDQPCDHDDDDAGGPACCRGLRCSMAGHCELDCVSEGESCRYNWFCCHGHSCNRRNDDFICQ